MIADQYYLTQKHASEKLQTATDLSPDEVEHLVGRFRNTHYRFAGQLKGEVVIYTNGLVQIRHHFTKKVLWENL